MELIEDRAQIEPTLKRLPSPEQARIGNLLALVPTHVHSILDAGARDGRIALKLAERAFAVTALDLDAPAIQHCNVLNVEGDITHLEFPDHTFDLVLCAEVLEHIPPRHLLQACAELQRVARHYVLIGVPYRQDTRIARTTCYTCGQTNPLWGHVNTFNVDRLVRLFATLNLERIAFVGTTRHAANALSTRLLDWAGNPYGTYDQDEPCIHCGAKLKAPPPRSFTQRVLTHVAIRLNQTQSLLKRPQPTWVHALFAR